jgi:hypothetical protein
MKFLAVALLLLTANAVGAPERQSKPDYGLKYDDACVNAAAAIIASKDARMDYYTDPKTDQYVSLCKKNPAKDICDEANQMIRRNGINYSFACTGGG